eukprot:tig00000076_g2456.t1
MNSHAFAISPVAAAPIRRVQRGGSSSAVHSARGPAGGHVRPSSASLAARRHFSFVPVAPATASRRVRFQAGPSHVTRCEASEAGPSTPAKAADDADWSALSAIVEKGDFAALSSKLAEMKEAGVIKRFGSYPRQVFRPNIGLRDLSTIGIKNPEKLSGSTPDEERNATFAYIGVISVISVFLTYLPGDFGFFVPYLVSSTVLVLLGIGSTNPGLLRLPIDLFNRLSPDYVRRIARHEASHFLAGYALGLPVKSYTTEAAVTAVQFADVDVEAAATTPGRRGRLTLDQIDTCTVVAMSGIAGEGLEYPEARGGQADLAELQAILNAAPQAIGRKEQMERTRWGVFAAAALLKNNAGALEALTEAVLRGDSVVDCIRAIEAA